ncbi:dihydrolipoamide acetyltransferase family protein [Ralstonia syzygii]|uniref:dihydrolipoamide acetyltransferase family protein n=1 Tax=Ralstonia syzygii TaxID=28097 RepID=UPI0023DC1811|nr:dihydrolipoamide acetyltransferase family protein [Ralstonia syzygii]
MRREVLMPKLGLTMTEGALVEWMVSPGADFKAGDGLFVVETDKVANEIATDTDGKLLEALVAVGETVPVGTVLGYYEDGKQEPEHTDAAASRDQAGMQPKAGSAKALGASTEERTRSSPQSEQSKAKPSKGLDRVVATPLARRVAAELGVDLHCATGTGPRGRIKVADVRTAAVNAAAVTHISAPASEHVKADAAIALLQEAKKVRPTPTQLTMARRLTQAKQQVPHFYLASEAEVSALLELRGSLNKLADHPKVTLTHLLVSAVARALRSMPSFNRVWEDEAITELPTIDVGVAVNTERGLLAPVVRNLGSSSFREIVSSTTALIDKARSGKLSSTDMSGGAISISNAGMHDVTYMTSIINPGQSTILGVGSIREVFRPNEHGQPVLHREIGLVLAADHRLFDGVGALEFLNAIVSSIENPLSLIA